MQTHLVALANQVTGSCEDVRCLKDKVFIQKVSTLLRTKDLYQILENGEVRFVCSTNDTVLSLYLKVGSDIKYFSSNFNFIDL